MESLSDIVTERSGRIIDVAFNRPTKKNALTLSMYSTLADLLTDAAKDDGIRVVQKSGTRFTKTVPTVTDALAS